MTVTCDNWGSVVADIERNRLVSIASRFGRDSSRIYTISVGGSQYEFPMEFALQLLLEARLPENLRSLLLVMGLREGRGNAQVDNLRSFPGGSA